jgi:hypothetical protein
MQHCEVLESRFMLAATALGKFPLKANAQWVYDVIEDGTSGSYTMRVLPTQETVGTTKAWVLSDAWSKIDVAIGDKGLQALKDRSVESGNPDQTIYDTPMMLLPASLTTGKATTFSGPAHGKTDNGEAWTGTMKVTDTLVRTERVTVPAGTFSAFRIQQTKVLTERAKSGAWRSTKTWTETFWFVKNVGIVKVGSVTITQFWRNGVAERPESNTWAQALRSYRV